MIDEYYRVLALVFFIAILALYVRLDLISYMHKVLETSESIKKAFATFSIANLILSPGTPPDWQHTQQVSVLGIGFYDGRTRYRTLDLRKFRFITHMDQYALALKYGFNNMYMYLGLYDPTSHNLLYMSTSSCTSIQDFPARGYEPLQVGAPLPRYIINIQVPVVLVCPNAKDVPQNITYTTFSGEIYKTKYLPAILVIQLGFIS